MTTLAINRQRDYEGTVRIEENAYPVIAADIIYEGAAVGIVAASGHARPLVAGDRFAGFAVAKADNAAGAAADINVGVKTQGRVKLPVAGAVISDNESRQPVYASDDDTFSFSPVGGSFVGFFERYISAGVGIVDFNTAYRDPYAEYTVREALSSTKTLDIEDNGKLFWCTATTVITLPAVAVPTFCKIVNGAAFGVGQTSISPNASDKVRGPDLAGADNKDLINTLATSRRGDFARLVVGDADGPFVSELRGIWATEG